MELDASLYWVGMSLTPGLASRFSARVLQRFGSPEAVFWPSLTELEACQLPAAVAQAIHKQSAIKLAENEIAEVCRNGDHLVNWTEPPIPSGSARFTTRPRGSTSGATRIF